MKKLLLIVPVILMTACAGTDSGHSKIDGTRVYFELNSGEISPEANSVLKDVASYMKSNKSVNIVIEGNCDNRGAEQYNTALGGLRAANVGLVIMQNGVPEDRISVSTFGKSHASKGSGESVWMQDRNATIFVDGN